MRVFTKTESLIKFLNSLTFENKIGFVPTMGALHQGHLTLVDQATKDNDFTLVSIFINPTQFNNSDDLMKYPRDLQADLALLEAFDEELIVFCPSPKNLYGNQVVSKNYNFGGIENEMEGAFRPGHFDGVGTVLSIFFKILKPDKAYFGEKDFQQLQIIKKLVAIENLNVKIIGCPIFREANGLAFSSRNKRLTSHSKNLSSFIYKTLKTAKADFGIKNVHSIVEESKWAFSDKPYFKLEYFLIADVDSLKSVQEVDPLKKYRAFIAVFIDGVRLIDNIALN